MTEPELQPEYTLENYLKLKEGYEIVKNTALMERQRSYEFSEEFNQYKKELKTRLTKMIAFWRRSKEPFARYYIDAFQSVMINEFGESLPVTPEECRTDDVTDRGNKID